MLYSLLEGKMRSVVEDEKSRIADGSVNWTFVDDACYRDLIDFFRSRVDYYEYFNDIADMIESEFPVDTSVQLELAI